MDLKNTLKVIKTNESTISTILGVLVVIVVGILIVNYFRSRSAQPSVSVPGSQVTQVPSQPGTTVPFTGTLPTSHEVAKGENLWQIAQHYYDSGYNWVDIAKANKLANPNGLAIGQKLDIPDVPAKAKTVAQLPSTGVSSGSSASIEGSKYTIEKGDSLWNIAVRAYGDGFKWVQIAKENNIKNPNIIHPGNELSIPR